MSERDRDLLGLGFVWRDGELLAPGECRVKLVSVRDRYQVRIGLHDGNALVLDLPKHELKITREPKP